ncbi:class I SAM-dependent methyltransferase [Hydrogenophaga sp. 5NK40-0174]|uniref:class I SAM-dependent methyltransferase n=1 Tax=Hydrogenophaga sp. 5NK40-0174 TaxID=3127649 RepID=UPI003103FAC5
MISASYLEPLQPPDSLPLQEDELVLMDRLMGLSNQRIIELGCGNARTARQLLQRWPACQVTGLEVDAIQHERNLAHPQEGLNFVAAGAQDIPFADASFDIAVMLKSLHHVPMPLMDQALSEVARVLKPGGFLYVSEPIYGGALNELIRLYNDEGVVRPAAQAALDRALADGRQWEAAGEERFAQSVHYADFEDFAKRMMYPSFADHHITEEMLAKVRGVYEPHQTPNGADFVRPMHVRLLRRKA